ncbi:MAG: hypothetical protein JWN70_3918 [Planctomycetaceae bacterium]|nr:hypothetical protein [Planctomycetaceae bacterium]
MNPSVIPDVDGDHERRLKEISEEQRKTPSERSLPDQVADRTKRQVEKPETPRSTDK